MRAKTMNEVFKNSEKLGKFGKERVGIFRRIRTALRNALLPDTDDSDLWVMFRTHERMAMDIAKEVADLIEQDFNREEGQEFLDAFGTLCHSCVPDCINKIVRMMFKRPVYFKVNLGSETIQWLASLASPADQVFTVGISPVKVEYLSEFCVRANMLTSGGPYISAKFTTEQGIGVGSTCSTSGLFEIYVSADTFFDDEWELPGVIKYATMVTVDYASNAKIGSDKDMIMEIIRRCADDILNGRTLWRGSFGEDRPKVNKKSQPYYDAVLGFHASACNRLTKPEYCTYFPGNMSNMTKMNRKDSHVSTVMYMTGDNSNFVISGDKTDDDLRGNDFTITIYPPLEERPKPTPVNTTIDVHYEIDSEPNPDDENMESEDTNVNNGYDVTNENETTVEGGENDEN